MSDIVIRRHDLPESIRDHTLTEFMSIVPAKYRPAQKDIILITSQIHKVRELKEKMDPGIVNFEHRKLEVDELQHSDPLAIAQRKAEHAFEIVNEHHKSLHKLCQDGTKESSADLGDWGCPDKYVDEQEWGRASKSRYEAVLVEDVSLEFKALNGMPGPYIKWFFEAIDNVGLHKMLAGFEDKTAKATCTYALKEAPNQVVFCQGSVDGRIVEPEPGAASWGWDPIFEESRSGLTFSQMDPATKSEFSHRARALEALTLYLRTTRCEMSN